MAVATMKATVLIASIIRMARGWWATLPGEWSMAGGVANRSSGTSRICILQLKSASENCRFRLREHWQIPVENRYFFTNLSELTVKWQLGDQQGTAHADVAPQSSGTLQIPVTLPYSRAANCNFVSCVAKTW